MEPRLLLQSYPVISEFLAINSEDIYPGHPTFDETDWDWIEIHNPTSQNIDMAGWHLTDDKDDLSGWTFPTDRPDLTTLDAGDYLIVYASGLADGDPDYPDDLHADFALSGSGEYLALVGPDPTPDSDDVVQVFDPFPKQVSNVSYGLGESVVVGTTLIGEGHGLTALVPSDGTLGTTWTQVGFNDSGWIQGETSVGYETEPGGGAGGTSVNINFQPSGSDIPAGYLPDYGYAYGDRGNGYTYGWEYANYETRDRGSHPDQRYDTLNHLQKTTDEVWEIELPNGEYNLFVVCGDPTATNQTNSFDFEGVIRNDPDGEDNFDEYALGVTVTDGRLTVRPAPGASNAKICFIDITSAQEPSYEGLIVTDLQTPMHGVNTTAYVRLSFDVNPQDDFQSLVLRMMYDDGFVAYLNGTQIAERNAPGSPQWDSAAADTHPDTQALAFENIDVVSHVGALNIGGENVLAIHALDHAGDTQDFLIVPELVADVHIAAEEHYFETPTPGEANVDGALGLVADTTFSIDRGFFTDAFTVAIACDTPDAVIYYMTDGRSPLQPSGAIHPDATKYTAEVPISTTTTLRAVAWKPGYIPSNADTQTYLFLGDVIDQDGSGWPNTWGEYGGDYEMDPDIVYDGGSLRVFTDLNGETFTVEDALLAIPSVSIAMNPDDLFASGQGIYPSGENSMRYCSAELIHPDGTEGFQINASIEIVGGTSVNRWKTDTLSMRLKFHEPYGPTKLGADVFEDTPVDRFDTLVLDARLNNVWNYGNSNEQRNRGQYTRDQFVADLQNALTGYGGPHGIAVHLYLDGLYWGIYRLHERPDASYAAETFGGERDDYYAIKHEATLSRVVEPDSAEDPTGAQAALNDYNAMYSLAGGASDPAKYTQLCQNLDVPAFIDYMITNFYVGNTDWAHQNWYATRNHVDPDGRWRYHSWDAEHVMESTSANVTGKDDYREKGPTAVHQRLCANAEYRMLFADHVHRHFANDGVLTTTGATAMYNEALAEVDRAVAAESARWGDNQINESHTTYTRDGHWMTHRNWLLNSYFSTRTNTVLGQLENRGLYPDRDVVKPGALNINGSYQHGGEIAAGDLLTLTDTRGTVYYTTDGSDPIYYDSGWHLGPSAVAYTGSPIVLAGNTHIKARARSGSVWSALNEATFVVPVPDGVEPADHIPIRITEIMYNPAQPGEAMPEAAYPYNESFEYIELQNTSATDTVNTAGLVLSCGVTFTFPSIDLAPGEHLLVVKSETGFEARYGMGYNVAGQYRVDTRLDNGGETIELATTLGEVIQAFNFRDGWFDHTDGEGFSLVVRDPLQDPALWDSKDGWRASWLPGGNPGEADPGPVNPGDVVINEVLAHQDDPVHGDWIELKNTTGAAIDIGGWYLSDDRGQPDKYRIADGTMIGDGECLVFTEEAHFGTVANPPSGFALDELGEEVFLTSASGGVLAGYREDEFFGASDRDVTSGRYVKSTGSKDFVALVEPTMGGDNAAPIVPDVILSEIMYHPELGGHEFIELHNRTASAVPLHDAELAPNPWQFTDGIDFAFPTDASVPANGYALVVGIDPDLFRTTYGIDAAVPIYGPWDGALANEGERVELSRPGTPEPGGFVPYIPTEKITYNDGDPWPLDPDGLGPSLERRVAGAYGNDVINWAASTAASGTPGAANSVTPPPVVTAVALNPHPNRTARGLGQIDPGGLGVETVLVTFSKDVTFLPGHVTAEKVTFDALGNETGAVSVTPESVVYGATNAEILITFADSWQTMVDTWVRITLADTITDGGGQALDGEPRSNSSGLGYIYDSGDDLPSGDGAAGGAAVFYVGSLRADMRGYGPGDVEPDGEITPWDITGFTQKYLAEDLDADMAGYGPGQAEPDTDVNPWDISGFTSRYSAAMAAGTHLEPLPTGGEGLAVGTPAPLPLTADETVSALTAAPEIGLLTRTAAEPAPVTEPASPPANESATLAPSASDDVAPDLLVASGDPAPSTSAPWSPVAPDAPATETPLAADGGLIDLLAAPALEMPLTI